MKKKKKNNFCRGCTQKALVIYCTYVYIYRVRHLTFFFQLVLIPWLVRLSSCLIWQIICFILPPNEYAKRARDRLTEDADFGKTKVISSDEAYFDLGGYVAKQNYHIWGTENPHTYIEKPMHPQWVTVWCRFWSRDIIGPFFLRKWSRRGRYSKWRSLSGHVERSRRGLVCSVPAY